MCTGAEIVPIISAVATVAGTAAKFAGAFDQPVPEGPTYQIGGPGGEVGAAEAALPPDRMAFGDVRPGELMDAPSFLRLGTDMTDVQKRANIATRAVAGDDASFRDPAAQDYYRNLALYGLTDPSGSVIPGAEPLPIERQYLEQVVGVQPNTGTTESFLSALLRA